MRQSVLCFLNVFLLFIFVLFHFLDVCFAFSFVSHSLCASTICGARTKTPNTTQINSFVRPARFHFFCVFVLCSSAEYVIFNWLRSCRVVHCACATSTQTRLAIVFTFVFRRQEYCCKCFFMEFKIHGRYVWRDRKRNKTLTLHYMQIRLRRNTTTPKR